MMNFFSNIKEKKNEFFKRENIFLLFFVFLIFFFDRVSKIKIINSYSENVYYINSFLNFDLIWNIGIGFGLFSTDTSLYYNLVTTIIGVVILILLYISAISKKFDKFIYSFIIGGALGNFYDRLTFNAVPDFIDIHYKDFHWFTFNVADIFISFGIILYMCKNLFSKN